MTHQPGILAAVPQHASFVFFDLQHGKSAKHALDGIGRLPHPEHLVLGLGPSAMAACNVPIPGLRPMPSLTATGVTIPNTPTDLFIRVSGADPGEVLHRERAILASLDAFEIVDRVDAFQYGESRDLTGYEDGTENPTGEKAHSVALQSGNGPGLDGSSVVAIQRWEHDLDTFEAMPPRRQDHTFGRNRRTNVELDEAPANAHVKRTAQEDFSPEAFVVRRSMPCNDHRGTGLVFVAFAATLDPFEALLGRMTGQQDGIVDALFDFTRPITGATWWCPPLDNGHLDLRALRALGV